MNLRKQFKKRLALVERHCWSRQPEWTAPILFRGGLIMFYPCLKLSFWEKKQNRIEDWIDWRWWFARVNWLIWFSSCKYWPHCSEMKKGSGVKRLTDSREQTFFIILAISLARLSRDVSVVGQAPNPPCFISVLAQPPRLGGVCISPISVSRNTRLSSLN